MADRCRVEQSYKSNTAQVVSTAAQLQNEAVVSGEGAPTHKPDRTGQIYTDNDSKTQYTWYSGTWSH